MFSIGFAELLVIAVIILLVVGPERLPETIRFVSINIAKFRRYWQSTRREIEKDLGLDDLRREIHNAAVMEHLEETKKMLNKPALKDADGEPKVGIDEAAFVAERVAQEKAETTKNEAETQVTKDDPEESIAPK